MCVCVQPQDRKVSCRCVLSSCPFSSQLAPAGDAQPQKSRLSRTLSDVASTESEPTDPASAQVAQKATFDLSDNSVRCPVGVNNLPGRQPQLFSNGRQEVEEKEPPFHSCRSHGSDAQGADQTCSKHAAAFQLNGGGQEPEAGSCDRKEAGTAAQPLGSGGFHSQHESPLIPMTLYLHRVKGLVLALLVEPHFLNDSASMEEVVRTGSAHNQLMLHLTEYL